jgi:ribosomal protein L13/ribosomal protein L17
MHRHGYIGRKFGRETDQRGALLKGLATSLVLHGKIETTLPKAKELVRYIEKLITKAKKGGLHNRRQVISALSTEAAAFKLFDEIAPQLTGRTSGHVRVERTALRVGDGTQMAIIEFGESVMVVNAKTYSQKPTEVSRRWILIDASTASIGRVASAAAKYLIGKYRPTYTPHVDSGDYVIIINAEKAVATGNKETDKKYYRHSGFPGGITELSLKEMREKSPEKIIELAVKGMIPVNKLSADRLARLRVFSGSDHAHTAQTPEKVEVK